MKGLHLTSSNLKLVTAGIICLLPSIVLATQFPEAGDFQRGAKIWAENCGRCHNIRGPQDMRNDQWITSMFHMRVRAGLTGQETRDTLTFLQTSNTPVSSTINNSSVDESTLKPVAVTPVVRPENTVSVRKAPVKKSSTQRPPVTTQAPQRVVLKPRVNSLKAKAVAPVRKSPLVITPSKTVKQKKLKTTSFSNRQKKTDKPKAVKTVTITPTSSTASGKKIYQRTCIACHGTDGTGALPGVPDLTKKAGRLSQPDATLIKNMTQGFQSPGSPMAMPPKGGNPNLTNADIKAVLGYLRKTYYK